MSVYLIVMENSMELEMSSMQVTGLPFAYTFPSKSVVVRIFAVMSPEWQSMLTL